MVAEVPAPTEVVETEKLAEDCPAGMVTMELTCTAALVLCRFTVAPFADAGALRTTVPLSPPPPTMDIADKVTPPTHGAAVTGG